MFLSVAACVSLFFSVCFLGPPWIFARQDFPTCLTYLSKFHSVLHNPPLVQVVCVLQFDPCTVGTVCVWIRFSEMFDAVVVDLGIQDLGRNTYQKLLGKRLCIKAYNRNSNGCSFDSNCDPCPKHISTQR